MLGACSLGLVTWLKKVPTKRRLGSEKARELVKVVLVLVSVDLAI